MAVGTDDFTFLDLSFNLFPRSAISDHEADVVQLYAANMVEFEDDRVGFAAVDACPDPEVLVELLLTSSAQPLVARPACRALQRRDRRMALAAAPYSKSK